MNTEVKSKVERIVRFREIGYTPSNLKLLVDSLGITTERFAKQIGVTPRTVLRWCCEPDQPSHVNCSYSKWRQILDFYEVNTSPIDWQLIDEIKLIRDRQKKLLK